jgi:hypothetical protein
MNTSLRQIEKMNWVAGVIATVVVLVMSAGMASAKKKVKAYLPDYVLKAQTVLVVILPDAGEPIDDPSANRKAQVEVEKAFMKWGRYRLALDTNTADLVIGVRKGTGKVENPTINGGPVDSRPASIETTDNQVRVLVQQGRDQTQQGTPTDTSGPNSKAHPGMEVGAEDDTFMVFQGGLIYRPSPLDNASVWKYIAKDGLKPPAVAAVEQFRKAVEDSEKAAAQKQQQQQQQQQQKKNP